MGLPNGGRCSDPYLQDPSSNYSLLCAAPKQTLEHTNHYKYPSFPEIFEIRVSQVTLMASLATRTSAGYRHFPLHALMEIHEGGSWESMSKN